MSDSEDEMMMEAKPLQVLRPDDADEEDAADLLPVVKEPVTVTRAAREIIVAKEEYARQKYAEGFVCDFHTIGEALSIALDGDRVSVFPGKYEERIAINKAVIVVGMSRSHTDDVVTLTSASTSVVVFNCEASIVRLPVLLSVVLLG